MTSEQDRPPVVPAVTPERRKSSTLILDIFGMHVRRLGGWVSVADLVDLMEDLGVASGPTRNAVSRMARAGTLERVQRDGAAGYSVAAGAEPAMIRADRRIYSTMAPAKLEDGWVIAMVAVPESKRKQRDQLRKELTWLGFGNIGNGVWIAPARAQDDLLMSLSEHDDAPALQVFVGDYLGTSSIIDVVANAWDLVSIDALYRGFLDECESVLGRWSGIREDTRAAFIDHTEIVHSWRKFPYLDPGLPSELLPEDWICAQAVEKFQAIVGKLEKPAEAYVADRPSFS